MHSPSFSADRYRYYIYRFYAANNLDKLLLYKYVVGGSFFFHGQLVAPRGGLVGCYVLLRLICSDWLPVACRGALAIRCSTRGETPGGPLQVSSSFTVSCVIPAWRGLFSRARARKTEKK